MEEMRTGLLKQGYEIVANYANKIVVAYNPCAVERYVVWRLDNNGEPYWGTYTDNPLVARNEFCARIVNGI